MATRASCGQLCRLARCEGRAAVGGARIVCLLRCRCSSRRSSEGRAAVHLVFVEVWQVQ